MPMLRRGLRLRVPDAGASLAGLIEAFDISGLSLFTVIGGALTSVTMGTIARSGDGLCAKSALESFS